MCAQVERTSEALHHFLKCTYSKLAQDDRRSQSFQSLRDISSTDSKKKLHEASDEATGKNEMTFSCCSFLSKMFMFSPNRFFLHVCNFIYIFNSC